MVFVPSPLLQLSVALHLPHPTHNQPPARQVEGTVQNGHLCCLSNSCYTTCTADGDNSLDSDSFDGGGGGGNRGRWTNHSASQFCPSTASHEAL